MIRIKDCDQWPAVPQFPSQSSDQALFAEFESAAFGADGLLAKLVQRFLIYAQNREHCADKMVIQAVLDSLCVLLAELLQLCPGMWQVLNGAATAADKLITSAATAGLLDQPSVAVQTLVQQLLLTCRIPLSWASSRLQAAAAADSVQPAGTGAGIALRRQLKQQAQHLQNAMKAAGIQPAALSSAVLQQQLSADACTRTCFFTWRVLARVALLCPGAALQPGKESNAVVQLWMDAYDVACMLELLPFELPSGGAEAGVHMQQLTAADQALLAVQWLPICLQAALQQTARAWLSKAVQASGAHALPRRMAELCVRQVLSNASPGAVFCLALTDHSLITSQPQSGALVDAQHGPLLAGLLRWLSAKCAREQAASAAQAQLNGWLTAVAAGTNSHSMLQALQRIDLAGLQVGCVDGFVAFLGGVFATSGGGQANGKSSALQQSLASAAALLLESASMAPRPDALLAVWGRLCTLAPSLYCTCLLGHAGLALVTYAAQGGGEPTANICATILSHVQWPLLLRAFPSGGVWARRWLGLLDGIAARAVATLSECRAGQATAEHLAALRCLLAAACALGHCACANPSSGWCRGGLAKGALDKAVHPLRQACTAVVGTAALTAKACVVLLACSRKLTEPVHVPLKGVMQSALQGAEAKAKGEAESALGAVRRAV